MTAYTDQPGVQFYGGELYERHQSHQGWEEGRVPFGLFVWKRSIIPIRPNEPSFPSTELKPGADI